MPYKDPDPDDPHMLVGVSLPAGGDAAGEVAAAIADEFAAMGFGEEKIMGLFRRPFYAGAHRAMRQIGEEKTLKIVQASLAVWGRRAIVVKEAAPGDHAGGGPMLQIDKRPAARGLTPAATDNLREE